MRTVLDIAAVSQTACKSQGAVSPRSSERGTRLVRSLGLPAVRKGTTSEFSVAARLRTGSAPGFPAQRPALGHASGAIIAWEQTLAPTHHPRQCRRAAFRVQSEIVNVEIAKRTSSLAAAWRWPQDGLLMLLSMENVVRRLNRLEIIAEARRRRCFCSSVVISSARNTGRKGRAGSGALAGFAGGATRQNLAIYLDSGSRQRSCPASRRRASRFSWQNGWIFRRGRCAQGRQGRWCTERCQRASAEPAQRADSAIARQARPSSAGFASAIATARSCFSPDRCLTTTLHLRLAGA